MSQPDYLVVTGSRLYGTARYNEKGECISDEDLRGFVIPPLDYLIGLQIFKEGEAEGEDHKVYSLKNWFELLIKGNAQALECMFVPDSHVRTITDVGQQVLDRRGIFVGKHFYKAITGFSYSEWNKVIGVKQVPVERSFDEKRAIDAFRNAFKHLPKDKWDAMLEIAYSEHARVMVDAKQDVGEKRRAEYEKFGYCATCAHHALRLLYQCHELLTTGFMTFPLPQAALLSAVKRGEMKLEEIDKLHKDIAEKVDKAYQTSSLPERADTKAAWNLYREIVYGRIAKELRDAE